MKTEGKKRNKSLKEHGHYLEAKRRSTAPENCRLSWNMKVY
jgi:hypothetical protein